MKSIRLKRPVIPQSTLIITLTKMYLGSHKFAWNTDYRKAQ